MRLVSNIIPLEATSLLRLIFVPIGFISCSFHLDFSDLLDFIVVDQKHLTFNVMIMEILFGLSSIIWFLEANVSISLAFFVNTNMNIFNFTKRFKDFCQVFFFPFLRKIFYIKVTSLVLTNTFMKIYLIRINLLF